MTPYDDTENVQNDYCGCNFVYRDNNFICYVIEIIGSDYRMPGHI